MLVTLSGKGFMSFLSSFLTARGRQIMINKDGCRKGAFRGPSSTSIVRSRIDVILGVFSKS